MEYSGLRPILANTRHVTPDRITPAKAIRFARIPLALLNPRKNCLP
jgi:hypothetical protein